RRPLASPLLPYPPLFRSMTDPRAGVAHSDLRAPQVSQHAAGGVVACCADDRSRRMAPGTAGVEPRQRLGVRQPVVEPEGVVHVRSEEHTSELQSLTNLVC